MTPERLFPGDDPVNYWPPKDITVSAMKTIQLLVIAMLMLSMTVTMFGCAASQETRLATEPRTYYETMEWLRDEVRLIDKHIIGAQYDEAVPDAERLREFTKALSRFEPPRMPENREMYDEYFMQVEDLSRATDRLLFFVEQRRKADAQDQLVEVARRYNRLSVSYGPSIEVSVLERSPEEFRGSETYRGEVPGELRGNR